MTYIESVMVEAFGPIILMLSVFAKASGFFIILSAIFSLKKYAIEGDTSQFNPWRVLLTIGIGVLLYHTDQFLLDWHHSIFGQSAPFPLNNPFSYSNNNDPLFDKFDSFKRAIILFIQMWGFFSFVRGLHVWHQTTLGYKNSTLWKGAFHCLGGAIAVNFNFVGDGAIEFLKSINPMIFS